MNRNKLRITDIAALPNVSTGTVDRVLHDSENVVEEAKKTILSSVDKIEYALNLLAESFSSKKHYQISVLIPDSSTDNTYCILPIIGIKKAGKEMADFDAVTIYFRYKPSKETNFMEQQQEVVVPRSEGLIPIPVFSLSSKALTESCAQFQIPFILIDALLEDCNNLSLGRPNSLMQTKNSDGILIGCDLSRVNREFINPATIELHVFKCMEERGYKSAIYLFSYFNN